VVGAGHILLTLAEREVVAAVGGELLIANVAVAAMRDGVAPGVVARLFVERAGPLVVCVHRKTVLHCLGKSHLQGVEFGVLVVAR